MNALSWGKMRGALVSRQVHAPVPQQRKPRAACVVLCEANRREQPHGQKLQVVFITTEIAPWSKVGGLADVLAGLPAALAARGHRVMTVAPMYDDYDDLHDTGIVLPVEVPPWGAPLHKPPSLPSNLLMQAIDAHGLYAHYWHTRTRGVDHVFVRHAYYRDAEVYGDGSSYTAQATNGATVRHNILCQAALAAPVLLWDQVQLCVGDVAQQVMAGGSAVGASSVSAVGDVSTSAGTVAAVHASQQHMHNAHEHPTSSSTKPPVAAHTTEDAVHMLMEEAHAAGIDIAPDTLRQLLMGGGGASNRNAPPPARPLGGPEDTSPWQLVTSGGGGALRTPHVSRHTTRHTARPPRHVVHAQQSTETSSGLTNIEDSTMRMEDSSIRMEDSTIAADGSVPIIEDNASSTSSSSSSSSSSLPLLFVANDWPTAPALLRLNHVYRHPPRRSKGAVRAWQRVLQGIEQMGRGGQQQSEARDDGGGHGNDGGGGKSCHDGGDGHDDGGQGVEGMEGNTTSTIQTSSAKSSTSSSASNSIQTSSMQTNSTVSVAQYYTELLQLRAVLQPRLARAHSVLCVHNLAYQGIFHKASFGRMCLPASCLIPLTCSGQHNGQHASEQHDRGNPGHSTRGLMAGAQHATRIASHVRHASCTHVNWLQAAIRECDALVTVSPGYAREIQQDALLSVVVAAKPQQKHVFGIMNGIDTSAWSPETDVYLDQALRYSSTTVTKGKAMAKLYLQTKLGLCRDVNAPLFAFVGRLTQQKGVDVLLAAAPALLATGGGRGGRYSHSTAHVTQPGTSKRQLVMLGTGGMWEECAIKQLHKAFPGQAAGVAAFDEALAHLVYAAADILVVPSRFEPCGLVAQCGARYGAVPVVAATGGLQDLVTPEVGYSFPPVGRPDDVIAFRRAVEGLLRAMLSASGEYEEGGPFRAKQQACMALRLSWERPAAEWERVLLDVACE